MPDLGTVMVGGMRACKCGRPLASWSQRPRRSPVPPSHTKKRSQPVVLGEGTFSWAYVPAGEAECMVGWAEMPGGECRGRR